MEKVRLGLIGDHVAASMAPRLHAAAGRMRGVEVIYDLLVRPNRASGSTSCSTAVGPGATGGSTSPTPGRSGRRRGSGSRAPSFARWGRSTRWCSGRTARGGSIPTTRASSRPGAPAFGAARPGTVCQVGAGGVGKAVAFGARRARGGGDPAPGPRPEASRAPRGGAPGGAAEDEGDRRGSLKDAVRGARGIVNCSPVGMVGHEGTPVPSYLLPEAVWAFDAVYTPADTRFLAEASAAGLETLNGYELFFEQGANCAEIFLGGAVDRSRLRQALAEPRVNRRPRATPGRRRPDRPTRRGRPSGPTRTSHRASPRERRDLHDGEPQETLKGEPGAASAAGSRPLWRCARSRRPGTEYGPPPRRTCLYPSPYLPAKSASTSRAASSPSASSSRACSTAGS